MSCYYLGRVGFKGRRRWKEEDMFFGFLLWRDKWRRLWRFERRVVFMLRDERSLRGWGLAR